MFQLVSQIVVYVCSSLSGTPGVRRCGIQQFHYGSGGRGLISFLFFSVLVYLLVFHLSAGMKGSGGGGAPPSSRLARRRRGFLGPVILQ